MTKITETARSRRLFLLSALSQGCLVGGLGWNTAALAQWFGRVPKPLPPGQSIFQLDGKVLINGQVARRDSAIQASDRIEAGPGGSVIFAVGSNAYILRERSILELSGKALFVRAMRLVSGALLGVFGQREEDLAWQTPSATIGIRGTAVYARVDPGMTYACTCYGQTRITARADAGSSEVIRSEHHDAPRWILDRGEPGGLIIPAPVIDHTDLELMILEALCGRSVPFATPAQPYAGPRRRY